MTEQKEQAAREQAAREQTAREQAAREQAERDAKSELAVEKAAKAFVQEALNRKQREHDEAMAAQASRHEESVELLRQQLAKRELKRATCVSEDEKPVTQFHSKVYCPAFESFVA